ncbi:MAG: hypothetical protein WCI71_11205 [Bacteroidota bacterium]
MNKWVSVTTMAVTLLVYACKHTPESPPACIAGRGGGVTIVVYALNGGIRLPNYYAHPDTAFVKFGTTISPGPDPAGYNTYYVSEPGEDHIHCMGLKCGDYFVYRTAWDSAANVVRYGGNGISIADTTGDMFLIVTVN